MLNASRKAGTPSGRLAMQTMKAAAKEEEEWPEGHE